MRQNKNSFDVVTELQKAYALVSTQPEAQDLSAEIAFFKTVKVFLTKLEAPDNPDDSKEIHSSVDYRMQITIRSINYFTSQTLIFIVT